MGKHLPDLSAATKWNLLRSLINGRTYAKCCWNPCMYYVLCKGTGHWVFTQNKCEHKSFIIMMMMMIKAYLVTSNRELLSIIHCDKRLPLKVISFSNIYYASKNTNLYNKAVFCSLFLFNFDDQSSQNFCRFVILWISQDTPNENNLYWSLTITKCVHCLKRYLKRMVHAHGILINHQDSAGFIFTSHFTIDNPSILLITNAIYFSHFVSVHSWFCCW